MLDPLAALDATAQAELVRRGDGRQCSGEHTADGVSVPTSGKGSHMGYGAAAAQPEPQGRLAYKWKVLISVIFGIFMIILDTTVVNVAFQTIRGEYNTSLNNSQWIISIYVLALGIGTPMSGYLADRFGIKRMYAEIMLYSCRRSQVA